MTAAGKINWKAEVSDNYYNIVLWHKQKANTTANIKNKLT